MIKICPTKVICECDDSPITQEAPDGPSFLSVCYPAYVPRLSTPFQPIFGVRWCFSSVSLAEAISCCNEVPPPVVVPVSSNAQSVSCDEGTALVSNVDLPDNLSISGSTLTVAAGSFSAPTIAEANTLAAAYVSSFLDAGLASGDLECLPDNPWVITPNPCIPDGIITVGNSASLSIDSGSCSSPEDCYSTNEPLEGDPPDHPHVLIPITRSGEIITKVYGPYLTDKILRLVASGTVQTSEPYGSLYDNCFALRAAVTLVVHWSGEGPPDSLGIAVNDGTGFSSSGSIDESRLLLAGNTLMLEAYSFITGVTASSASISCNIAVFIENPP